MDLRASVIAQLRSTQAGDPWYGASRAAVLTGISAAHAAAYPIAGAHSIWEIVLHMTAWTHEVTRRLAGCRPAQPEAGDWPAVTGTTDQDWSAAGRDLEQVHGALVASITALPLEGWSMPVGLVRDLALGTGVDVAGMLIGLAQHDAYHTGQIAMLKRALA